MEREESRAPGRTTTEGLHPCCWLPKPPRGWGGPREPELGARSLLEVLPWGWGQEQAGAGAVRVPQRCPGSCLLLSASARGPWPCAGVPECREPRGACWWKGWSQGFLAVGLVLGLSYTLCGVPVLFGGQKCFIVGPALPWSEQSDEEGWEQKLRVGGEGPCWRPEEEEGVFME